MQPFGPTPLRQTLRDYQLRTVARAIEHVETCRSDPRSRRNLMFALPMGTGKGSIQLAIRDALLARGLSPVILTPSNEVIRGALSRLAVDGWEHSVAAMQAAAERECIWTPVRLRNRVMSGDAAMPDVIIEDEAHHAVDTNQVSGDLSALRGLGARIGFTATPFRGTPKSSIELRELWGAPEVVLTWAQAVDGGYCAMPTFSILPLMDDASFTIKNGEFDIREVEAAFGAENRIEHLARYIEHFHRGADGLFDRPTMVALPSSQSLVREFVRVAGDWAVGITQETSFGDRSAAFELCRQRRAVIAQISVVGEGVDVPWLRRIFDARPTQSPVAWFQLVGRCTRPLEPGEAPPEVVVTTRNLERHAYLFEGRIPPTAAAASEAEFGGEPLPFNEGARFVDLPALNAKRYKPLRIPLRDGSSVTMYNLQATRGGVFRQFVLLAHPTRATPLIATRASLREGDTTQWGRWTPVATLGDITGVATARAGGELSEKQAAWWTRAAARHGLPDELPSSRRHFDVLPVLADTKWDLGTWR